MTVRHEGPHDTSDYPPLKVDIKRLSDLAATVSQEVDHNLRSQANQVVVNCTDSPGFGKQMPTGNSSTARHAYTLCQDELDQLVKGYVRTGQTLAAAARQIATQYGESDAMSLAKAKDVRDAIDAAGAKVDEASHQRMLQVIQQGAPPMTRRRQEHNGGA